jgi:Fur family transcriptional regulator, peroxide stress response regulator
VTAEAMKTLFADHGLKFTHQRYLVYRAMVATTAHPSAETVWRQVRDEAPAISLDTVYRTLAALERRGLVARVPGGGGEGRFDGNLTPHHHLVCLGCGRIDDFSMEGVGLADLPPRTADWGRIDNVQIVARGLCRACLDRQENSQPQQSKEHDNE